MMVKKGPVWTRTFRFRGLGMARAQVVRPRMRKQWDSIPGVTLALTASSTTSVGAFAATQALTIMRLLGEYLICPTGGGTFVANDRASITVGIGVVSTDAFVAGATSLPDPAGEPEYPWLYWAQHDFNLFTALAAGDWQGARAEHRQSFDIRSMRKMSPRQSLAFIIQYVDVSGVPPMSFEQSTTRVLFGIQ